MTQGRSNTNTGAMKIILLHPIEPVRVRLAEWLEKRGHTVVCYGECPQCWDDMMNEHRPDLVFLPELDKFRYWSLFTASIYHPECQFKYTPEPPLFSATGVSAQLGSSLTEIERVHQGKLKAA